MKRPSAPPPIEVTVRDPLTGETETNTVVDDYVITTAGSCYIASVQTFANGTHVVTIKGRKGP